MAIRITFIIVCCVKDVTAPTLGKVTAAIIGYTGTLSWSGKNNVGIVKYVVNCAGQTQTITSGTVAKFDALVVGKYKATVQGFDAAGNVSKTGSVSLTVKDATPPEKVIGLTIPLADAKYTAMLSSLRSAKGSWRHSALWPLNNCRSVQGEIKRVDSLESGLFVGFGKGR